MMTVDEKIHGLAQPGYWAAEVCLPGAQVDRPKYMIHAASDADAQGIALHLMGRARGAKAIGFNRYRVDARAVEAQEPRPIPMGASLALAAPQWAYWMAYLAEVAAERDLPSRAAAPPQGDA